MRDLLLIVPSRGRPQNMRRLMAAMEETCRADTHIWAGLDSDDPTLSEYQKIEGLPYALNTEGLRQVVAILNWMAVPASGMYRFIGHIGDDNLPWTEGWDQRVIETLEEVPMCFGDDLYPRPKGSLCCHIFMRSEIIRRLGYMGPPSFRSMFVDNVWMEWGKEIGIRFMEDVVIEHLHHGNGKAPVDETYFRSGIQMASGYETFQAYMADGLASDLAKIRALQPA